MIQHYLSLLRPGSTRKKYSRQLLRMYGLSCAVLFLSLVWGVVAARGRAVMMEDVAGPLMDIKEFFLGLEWWGRIIFVFLNNSLTTALVMFGGVFFGLISILVLIYNGYLIGAVSQVAGAEHGLGVVLAALLPHGIFELGVVLLAVAVGLRLGQVFGYCLRVKDYSNLKTELKISVGLFIFFILPVLFLAATIEVIVTPIVIYFSCPECFVEGIIG